MSKRALFDVDSRDRPKNPKKSTNAPLCHASDKTLAEVYKKQWREFMD